jgi:hypothetical protein
VCANHEVIAGGGCRCYQSKSKWTSSGSGIQSANAALDRSHYRAQRFDEIVGSHDRRLEIASRLTVSSNCAAFLRSLDTFPFHRYLWRSRDLHKADDKKCTPNANDDKTQLIGAYICDSWFY